MNLGQVYDLDLKRNEHLIKEVVLQAQGEVRVSDRYSDASDVVTDGTGRVLEAS
jgi:hypothetical protein